MGSHAGELARRWNVSEQFIGLADVSQFGVFCLDGCDERSIRGLVIGERWIVESPSGTCMQRVEDLRRTRLDDRER